MAQIGMGEKIQAGGGAGESIGGVAGGAAVPIGTVVEFAFGFLQYAMPQLVVNGGSSVAETVSLARNAVVLAPFLVTVRAGRAQWSRSGDVARIRTVDTSGNGQTRTSLVVDFGMLRTVNAVAVLNSLTRQVLQVKVWTGMGFADPPLLNADVPSKITSSTSVLTGFADAVVPFPSEVKTERLQIDLVGGGDEQALGQEVLVQLPDDPADLELRINDGPPVWTAPGAAVADVAGWQAAEGGLVQQQIDLSQALTALLGDPAADLSQTLELRLVLSARVPGALALELPAEGARTIRHITQVTQGFPDGARELQFPAEGQIPVSLPLPPWAKRVDEVRLSVSANLPPERVLPPLGPAAETIAGAGGSVPFAELVLDPDHAACLTLSPDTDLVELSALRLPIRVGQGGAEVRILLMSPDAAGEPGTALDPGASEPVSLEETAGGGEVWTTFTFPQPVTLDAGAPPFAAILVTRGGVRLGLGRVPDGSGQVPGTGEIWLGPPAGPWQRLPAVSVLAGMRGRFRMVGKAGRDKPVAPVHLALQGASDEETLVVPTAKGVEATIRPSASLAVGSESAVTLEAVSLVAGAVTVRGVRALVRTD
jgi:hypothetical protein